MGESNDSDVSGSGERRRLFIGVLFIGLCIIGAAIIVAVGMNVGDEPCDTWKDEANTLIVEQEDTSDPTALRRVMEDAVQLEEKRPTGCDRPEKFDTLVDLSQIILSPP